MDSNAGSNPLFRISIAAVLALALQAGALAAERPQIHGLSLPDNTIVVDGQRADWERAGELFTKSATVEADASHLEYVNTDRGTYGGAADCSYTVWTAVDTKNIYVYAELRDQILANEATPEDIFNGDDFEVFIDANLPAEQFAKTPNANVRQFIFLPAWINSKYPAGLIWQAEKNPGVKMASRLRPDGYSIEISIPKELFPGWKEHPENTTIGFDVVVGDADAPGLDGPHSSLKYAMYLLGAGFHPGSPETLGTLVFDQVNDTLTKPAPAVEVSPTATLLTALADPASDPLMLAQQILDRFDDAQAAEIAKIAVSHPAEPVRKAGLLLLARRSDLPAPVDALKTMLAPPKDAGYAQLNGHDWRTYALVALAGRGKLPVHDWFGTYTRLMASQSLELTYLWCLGINGDRAAVSDLVKLLYDSNLRVRIKAAMALGQLGDPLSLPALEEMAANDPHHYGRNEAKIAIAKIASGKK